MKIVKLSVFVLFMLAVVQISEAVEEKKTKEEKRFSDELSFPWSIRPATPILWHWPVRMK